MFDEIKLHILPSNEFLGVVRNHFFQRMVRGAVTEVLREEDSHEIWKSFATDLEYWATYYKREEVQVSSNFHIHPRLDNYCGIYIPQEFAGKEFYPIREFPAISYFNENQYIEVATRLFNKGYEVGAFTMFDYPVFYLAGLGFTFQMHYRPEGTLVARRGTPPFVDVYGIAHVGDYQFYIPTV